MNCGRYILSQVLKLVHRQTLDRLVQRYGAESKVRHFGCRQQLICMAFAQLTWREGLRDIATCLNARCLALYHLGFRERVAKSTLADAKEQRDWRLWEDRPRSHAQGVPFVVSTIQIHQQKTPLLFRKRGFIERDVF
jgi:hypothetical protein